MIKKISILLLIVCSPSTLFGMQQYHAIAPDQQRRVDVEQNNANGIKQLWIASKTGDLKKATDLLDTGIDPNTRLRLHEPLEFNGDHNSTFLHWAASGNHDKVAQLLLARGAQADAQDGCGRTPLSISLERFYPECAQLLLTAGAINPNVNNCLSTLCYNLMIKFHLQQEWEENRALAIIELLREHGARIDYQDDDGNTPLHFLAPTNNKLLVCALLVQGKAPQDCAFQDKAHKAIALKAFKTFLLVNNRKGTGLPQLPQDVVFHIFSHMPIECKSAHIENLVVPHCIDKANFRRRYLSNCWPDIQKHSWWTLEQSDILLKGLNAINKHSLQACDIATDEAIARTLNPVCWH